MTGPNQQMDTTEAAIVQALTEIGVKPHLTVKAEPSGPGSTMVQVHTMDAHPTAQAAIDEALEPFRRGHLDKQTGAYNPDNLREDVSQVDHVMPIHLRSKRLEERLDAYADAHCPDFRKNLPTTVQYRNHLFRGHIPGFWASETGNTESPTCTFCNRTLTDPTTARRLNLDYYTLYRHPGCPDFG